MSLERGSTVDRLIMFKWPIYTHTYPMACCVFHYVRTAARVIQIFDMDRRAKLKVHQMENDVVFWNWVDPSTIAIVTETVVYHWALTGEKKDGSCD